MKSKPWHYPLRISLARLPTPLEPLSCQLLPSGSGVYIKRDDLTGAVTTGNKIRKLEFLLAEARKQSCDTVITCGGVQSNHARCTAVAAASLGLRSVLFLRGAPDSVNEANLLLGRIVGAEVHFISAEEYTNDRNRIMQKYAEQLFAHGRKAYVVTEGGSNALGTWGYVKAVEETLIQVRRRGLRIGGLVAAVGSGGTHSGLLLGTLLLQWKIPVWGINICDDRDYFVARIENEIRETVDRFRLSVKFKTSDIRIIDGYAGDGYGIASPEVHGTIAQLAAETGIILEPVYTGKAFHGMLQEIGKGTFGKAPRLIFFHTGGIFGLLTGQFAAYYGK